ncbi:putative ribosome biogenesis protein RLP24 [Capsicum baccatum]|uniref:Ribosome biogenesis protein RLP24 n=1 Tax=Capsicum baccatum TaxID=33114 RepID=A0A2G2VWK4_CAPBA|nr:putative ribosome biogenesis protein RLP24 [Capsicum baccatum]
MAKHFLLLNLVAVLCFRCGVLAFEPSPMQDFWVADPASTESTVDLELVPLNICHEYEELKYLTISDSHGDGYCPNILKGYLSSITETDTDTKTETVGAVLSLEYSSYFMYSNMNHKIGGFMRRNNGSFSSLEIRSITTFVLDKYGDSTFEFERKRNRPDRYDRNVTENTLKAIKKIDKIKVDREERTIAKRMKGKKAKEQREAAKELEQSIHLVPVPEKHCLSRSRGLRKGSRRKIAGGMIILLPIFYILKLKHKSFHAYFYGMCNVLLSPTSRICMVWQLSLVSIETLFIILIKK